MPGRRGLASSRGGFTLVELLVVCSIVAVLAGLLIPAVQAARESARRARCAANLRQVGLGMQSYESVHRVFPSSMLANPKGYSLNDLTELCFLLPHVEQVPLSNAINMTFADTDKEDLPVVENGTARRTTVALYLCPSDGEPNHRNSYRFNRGRFVGSRRGGTLFDGPFSLGILPSPANITDGLSRTAFASEGVGGGFNKAAPDPSRDIKFPSEGPLIRSDDTFIPICLADASPAWRVTSGRYWYFSGFLNACYNHNGAPTIAGPPATAGGAATGAPGASALPGRITPVGSTSCSATATSSGSATASPPPSGRPSARPPAISEPPGRRGGDVPSARGPRSMVSPGNPAMLAALAALCLLQAKPGPLDPYRANLAAIRANLDFEERSGSIDRRAIAEGRLFDPAGLALEVDPSKGVVGRWEGDGTAQRVTYRQTDEATKLVPRPTTSGISNYLSPIEYLGDGRVQAYHHLDLERQSLMVSLEDGEHIVHRGPFEIFGEPVAKYLGWFDFALKPGRGAVVRGGVACELLHYRVEQDGKLDHAIEVALDPSIGYLPRFVREIGRLPDRAGTPGAGAGEMTWASLARGGPPEDRKGPDFTVTETYLGEARKSRAGGFVPIVWRQVGYEIPDFESKYPNYGPETVLKPPGSVVGLREFRASKFEDRTEPVRLVDLDKVVEVSGSGGSVVFPPGTKSLTLDRARSLLGRKLAVRKAVAPPNIDQAELFEFDTPHRRGRWPYPAIGAALAAIVLAAVAWRRRSHAARGPTSGRDSAPNPRR